MAMDQGVHKNLPVNVFVNIIFQCFHKIINTRIICNRSFRYSTDY